MPEAIDKAKQTLEARIGQRSEPTDWFQITQERIDQFADATLDHQWIHTDPERARKGPFGTTIAHGQLTMSIMSFLPGGGGTGLPAVEGVQMGINYGWNRVRFPAPVPVGAQVRTSGMLKSVEIKGPMLEIVNELTLEIKDSEKPGCVAESVIRLVF